MRRKLGRKYREGDAAKLLQGRTSNRIRIETYNRQNQRQPEKTIRETVKFLLRLDKISKLYTLHNKKEQTYINLNKDQVKEYELALITAQEFNETCEELFSVK